MAAIRFPWIKAIALFIGIACLVGAVLTGLPLIRELSRRTQCAKRASDLTWRQNAAAMQYGERGRPETFAFGTSGPGRNGSHDSPWSSDASRVYAWFARDGRGNRGEHLPPEMLACPSDPFVAALDASISRLTDDDTDLPTEGRALGGASRWASPTSVAAREDGHTWFSYSMQTNSRIVGAALTPKLNDKIPLFSDRNPECAIFADLGAGDSGPVGNSWNHNRGGQSVAFLDGHARFLDDAGELPMPFDWKVRDSAAGFDHLYNDEPVQSSPSRANRKCIPAGTAGTTTQFGAWMTD